MNDKLTERREIEMLRLEVMNLRRENNMLHAPVMNDNKFIPQPPTPPVFPAPLTKRRKQNDAVTVIYHSRGGFWIGFVIGIALGGIIVLAMLTFMIRFNFLGL